LTLLHLITLLGSTVTDVVAWPLAVGAAHSVARGSQGTRGAVARAMVTSIARLTPIRLGRRRIAISRGGSGGMGGSRMVVENRAGLGCQGPFYRQ